jgi:hypothetical protein
MIGVFIIQPQEGLFPNHGYKARAMFITKSYDWLRELWRFNEHALGSRNVLNGSLLHWKIVKEKKGKNKEYTGKLGSETKTTTSPRQRHQKCLLVLLSVSRKVRKCEEVPL